MALEHLKKRLEENGFAVSVFATGEEAAAYLNGAIDGRSVGCGGSMTLKELGLYDSLAAHNTLYYHGTSDDPKTAMKNAMTAEVYILSANAIAEDTGEILSIDGTGKCTSWPAKTRSPRILTAPCGACATWWPPRTPSAWAARPPARRKGTNATTATAPSASAGALWSTTRR